MPKSFKKFREEWEDDEWGNDDEHRRKDRKMESRRQKRRQRVNDKYSKFDESDDE